MTTAAATVRACIEIEWNHGSKAKAPSIDAQTSQRWLRHDEDDRQMHSNGHMNGQRGHSQTAEVCMDAQNCHQWQKDDTRGDPETKNLAL
jgi:hypothetical protein